MFVNKKLLASRSVSNLERRCCGGRPGRPNVVTSFGRKLGGTGPNGKKVMDCLKGCSISSRLATAFDTDKSVDTLVAKKKLIFEKYSN